MVSIDGKNLFVRDGERNIVVVYNDPLCRFDESKLEDCSNVDKITIDSLVGAVHVSVSDSSNAEVHFYGEANMYGDVNFDVQVVNRELKITLQFMGNCFVGNVKLDIAVPKKLFKVIAAESLSANITLDNNVSADSLDIKTVFGNLEINAKAVTDSISVTAASGSTEVSTKKGNVVIITKSGGVSVNTESGNVDVYTERGNDV